MNNEWNKYTTMKDSIAWLTVGDRASSPGFRKKEKENKKKRKKTKKL